MTTALLCLAAALVAFAAGLALGRRTTAEPPPREEPDEVETERRRFASVASHDLSEPLRTVHGFASLLERRYEGELDETGRTYLRHILGGTRRMQRLIDGLLAYGRLGRDGATTEPVELGATVRGVVEGLDARVEEVQATVLVDDLPCVEGDRAQLEQLFQNLLLNALKFHGDAAPHVEVGAERGDGGWRLHVADRGIGVPAGQREDVFAMFTRGGAGDERGAGIGLAVCARVVANHGGRIWVEDNPGGGSVFRFTLPDRA